MNESTMNKTALNQGAMTSQGQDFPFPDLNPAQRQAVEAADGPVLVLAGAGTGKTRVLICRLAWLLLTRRATPFQIFTVTFTNRAAREMAERVSHLLQTPVEGWYMGTFHSLAARILRRHPERVGLKPNFTILDEDDQIRLVKQILAAEDVDDKKSPARLVHAVISRMKDKATRPEQLSANEAGELADGKFRKIYAAYQERLKTINACDFADLLLYNLDLLQNHEDLRAEYQRRFRYLLVDEYQDTNVTQYLWLRLLAQGHRNLCVVGDDDQSIYSWRGAEIGNILRFEKDFPGATIVRLEQNYRSTGHILAAASHLIAHNRGRLGKTLWTAGESGEKIRLKTLYDGEDEARFVADEIEALQRRRQPLSQMAVLVRAGAQTREFEERFLTLGIPYRVVGGPRFYERLEIRDALAYFRATVVPEDDLAFERIINTPKRGVGDATVQRLHQAARGAQKPLQAAAWAMLETDELGPKLRTTLRGLLENLQRWRERLAGEPHADVARSILDESGYTVMWQADKSPEAPGRLENLKELISALAEFGTLPAFLEHVALVAEQTEVAGPERVTIMTLHAAKGLEFDTVFLPGWEEDLFPSRRSLEESGTAALEEERRLAYVGLTRARGRAIVSHALSRRLYGSWASAIPSRFLAELPAAHLDADQGFPQPRSAMGQGMGQGMRPGMGAAGGNFRPAFGVLQRNPQGMGKTLAAEARRIPNKKTDAVFERGDRVFHQKFGYGTVRATDDDRLLIAFDRAGEKQVMASFVVPADGAS